ncbi:MAG: response regulator [Lentisphaerae bacterium]|nr:response regulator [Lentisphaerota bacterium]
MLTASILIIDDEPIVRESLRDWLVDTGFEVATAETGEEGMEIFRKQEIDLIILDVRLPGRTGIRVLEEMKAMRPDVKAIVITAYASPQMRDEAMKLGALQFMTKPIAPEKLEKLVREALSRTASGKKET